MVASAAAAATAAGDDADDDDDACVGGCERVLLLLSRWGAWIPSRLFDTTVPFKPIPLFCCSGSLSTPNPLACALHYYYVFALRWSVETLSRLPPNVARLVGLTPPESARRPRGFALAGGLFVGGQGGDVRAGTEMTTPEVLRSTRSGAIAGYDISTPTAVVTMHVLPSSMFP